MRQTCLIPLLLLAAACTDRPADTAASGNATRGATADGATATGADAGGTGTAATPTPPAPPAPVPAGQAVAIAEKSALLEYSYKWPGEAAAIPALDARLRADAKTSRQRALNGARADRKARPADAPWNPHSFERAWTVEGEAAGLLALRDEFYTYTGGAHGMSGFEAILWDRAANDDIAVWSLFRDRAAAVQALTKLYCPALDRARAEKRGPAQAEAGPDWMTACPDVTKQIVIPAVAANGHFAALRVLIGPYEAGPYAEGSYEIEVPVTKGLAAMLRPERAGVLAPPAR